MALPNKPRDRCYQWQDSTLFSDKHQALLEYADTMSRAVVVPQAVFDKVRAHFDEQEMVELTVT